MSGHCRGERGDPDCRGGAGLQSKSMYVWHDDGMSAPRKRDFENDITSFKNLPRCCSPPMPCSSCSNTSCRSALWHVAILLVSAFSKGDALHTVQRGEARGGPENYRQGFASFSLKGGAGTEGCLSCSNRWWCSVVSEGCALSVPRAAAKAGTAASTAKTSATAPTTWSAFSDTSPMLLSLPGRFNNRVRKKVCMAQTALFPLASQSEGRASVLAQGGSRNRRPQSKAFLYLRQLTIPCKRITMQDLHMQQPCQITIRIQCQHQVPIHWVVVATA